MSKVKMAQRISVSNCECCGGVHVELWRDGKIFAVAIPSTLETAVSLAADLNNAVDVMRLAEGKPHVH